MGEQKRKDGFYKVQVYELGAVFETIGLWEYGHWKFAQGDGDEFGACYMVKSVNENLIMLEREYE